MPRKGKIMETISNQTCTKCQHCGEWTNYADDPHYKARDVGVIESIELTELEMAEIAARHGSVNDFGKTFFTDSELFEFVVAVMGENRRRCSNIRKAVMREATESRGVEW